MSPVCIAGGDAHLPVKPDAVVVHTVERNRVCVTLDFLAERIGEKGKPAHVHPYGEVLALDVRRRDVGHVGVVLNLHLAGARAFCGAIACSFSKYAMLTHRG